jgi:hypothetical protein
MEAAATGSTQRRNYEKLFALVALTGCPRFLSFAGSLLTVVAENHRSIFIRR